MSAVFGATGKFPDGKLNEYDEGELQFGVSSDRENQLVTIQFGKPVAWLAIPPALARNLAAILMAHAEQLEKTR